MLSVFVIAPRSRVATIVYLPTAASNEYLPYSSVTVDAISSLPCIKNTLILLIPPAVWSRSVPVIVPLISYVLSAGIACNVTLYSVCGYLLAKAYVVPLSDHPEYSLSSRVGKM